MILADTSIWIEFFKGNPKFFQLMRELLERQEVLGLSPIYGELLQGARDLREERVLLNYWESLPKINEEKLWIEAGKLSREKKLVSKGIDLIDSVIILASNQTHSKVWTLDKKIFGYLKSDFIYRV